MKTRNIIWGLVIAALSLIYYSGSERTLISMLVMATEYGAMTILSFTVFDILFNLSEWLEWRNKMIKSDEEEYEQLNDESTHREMARAMPLKKETVLFNQEEIIRSAEKNADEELARMNKEKPKADPYISMLTELIDLAKKQMNEGEGYKDETQQSYIERISELEKENDRLERSVDEALDKISGKVKDIGNLISNNEKLQKEYLKVYKNRDFYKNMFDKYSAYLNGINKRAFENKSHQERLLNLHQYINQCLQEIGQPEF